MLKLIILLSFVSGFCLASENADFICRKQLAQCHENSLKLSQCEDQLMLSYQIILYKTLNS